MKQIAVDSQWLESIRQIGAAEGWNIKTTVQELVKHWFRTRPAPTNGTAHPLSASATHAAAADSLPTLGDTSPGTASPGVPPVGADLKG